SFGLILQKKFRPDNTRPPKDYEAKSGQNPNRCKYFLRQISPKHPPHFHHKQLKRLLSFLLLHELFSPIHSNRKLPHPPNLARGVCKSLPDSLPPLPKPRRQYFRLWAARLTFRPNLQ